MFISTREKLYIEVVSSGVRGMIGRFSGRTSDIADFAHGLGMRTLRNYDEAFSKPKTTPLMFLRRILKPKKKATPK
ncbi:hypothetical protein FACS1894147_00860 [Spirochaetia bacterium]|nr:hypothetical protein FACS1894147_00860 [Spirochaetia bacterium]